jgi:hypothetical protein
MLTTYNRQVLDTVCPRSTNNGIPAGPNNIPAAQANTGPQLLARSTTSATAGVVNLGVLFKPAKNASAASTALPGLVGGAQSNPVDETYGNKLRVFAETTPLWVVFSNVITNVNGTSVPLATAVGSFNASGIYTPNANHQECYPIPAGTYAEFILQSGQDLFMGFVSNGAGIMTLYQSSRPNP